MDFCLGPHVPSSGRLKAFKVLSASNAYWKGDAKNQPMQRIYGTAFFSEKDLQAHLQRIEEAKKRDHRKIGRDLGLFWFHPWAPGEPFWLPKGTTLVHLLGNYMRGVLFPAGYVEVRAPLVFNKALWETSGHWEHYRENMFLVKSSDDEEMALKAMNCPGHFLMFASDVRSYQAICRSASTNRAAAPHGSVGCAERFDPRARVHHGRRALLRHGVADRRGSRAAAAARPARLRRFSPDARDEALDAAGRIPRREGHVGSRRSVVEAGARGGEANPTRSTPATARSMARRSTST